MTTATWSTTNSCTNDAEFRSLIVELQTKLAGVGLTHSTDTGQVNTATVTKPVSGGAVARYDIWEFNDVAQASAPIKIKLEYGVAGTAMFMLWLTVGSGTDGAGTITGTATTRRGLNVTSNSGVTGVSASYLCYKDGFLGLIYKSSGSNGSTCQCNFAICRTCDGAGNWTDIGAVVYTHHATAATNGGLPIVQALRFAAPATAFTASNGGFCMVPHANIATSSGNNPIWLHWMPSPDMVPVLGVCTHVSVQYPTGTFTATLIGATPRTYFTMGATAIGWGYGADNGTTQFCIAMLWE